MDIHQAADITGAEPWLVFKEEGVEVEVVADEDRRPIRIAHDRSVWSFCRHIPYLYVEVEEGQSPT